jgi:hypothetical protein
MGGKFTTPAVAEGETKAPGHILNGWQPSVERGYHYPQAMGWGASYDEGLELAPHLFSLMVEVRDGQDRKDSARIGDGDLLSRP